MRVKLPLLFDQGDVRWASKLLGYNTDPKYNFKNFACLISCEAMAARYYGKDETPVTINDKLIGLGRGEGFISASGNYIYGAITKIHSQITERLVRTPAPLSDAQYGEIRTALDSGNLVMIQIDVNPKTVENDTHFVLVVDYNPNDENDLTIADPIGGRLHSLKDYLGWFRPSMRKTIETYVVFSGPIINAGTPGSVAVPADIFPVIIHGSTEWDKTVGKYLPDSSPREKNFEDVQKVISSYAGQVTVAENARDQALRDAAAANTEIENQKSKLANIQEQCQREINLKNAEISVLSSNNKSIEKLKGEYQSTITALEDQLRASQRDGGIKDTEITGLKSRITELEQAKDGEALADVLGFIVSAITEFLKSIKRK